MYVYIFFIFDIILYSIEDGVLQVQSTTVYSFHG